MPQVAPREGSVDRNTFFNPNIRCVLRSLPARGAWIEISKRITEPDISYVAPREGSVDRNGVGDVHMVIGYGSLPARGAWIEITKLMTFQAKLDKSLPARGVWIEIKSIFREATRLGTPHGEYQSAGPQSSSIDEEAV